MWKLLLLLFLFKLKFCYLAVIIYKVQWSQRLVNINILCQFFVKKVRKTIPVFSRYIKILSKKCNRYRKLVRNIVETLWKWIDLHWKFKTLANILLKHPKLVINNYWDWKLEQTKHTSHTSIQKFTVILTGEIKNIWFEYWMVKLAWKNWSFRGYVSSLVPLL